MHRVYETKDAEKILSILNREGIKEYLLRNDVTADKDLMFNADTTYYLFEKDGILAGFAMFLRVNDFMALSDVGVLEEFRGLDAKILSKIAIEKFFKEKGCKNIVAKISKKNRRCFYYTKWFGFKKFQEDDEFNYLYLRCDYDRHNGQYI